MSGMGFQAVLFLCTWPLRHSPSRALPESQGSWSMSYPKVQVPEWDWQKFLVFQPLGRGFLLVFSSFYNSYIYNSYVHQVPWGQSLSSIYGSCSQGSLFSGIVSVQALAAVVVWTPCCVSSNRETAPGYGLQLSPCLFFPSPPSSSPPFSPSFPSSSFPSPLLHF